MKKQCVFKLDMNLGKEYKEFYQTLKTAYGDEMFR
jgi:hypothetical protein